MSNKNQEILVYLMRDCSWGVTSLIKLCYFVDLFSKKNDGVKISNYNYIRYSYGPFDKDIYKDIEELSGKGIIGGEIRFHENGETTFYSSTNKALEFKELKDSEKKIIDKILDGLKGYSARALTDLAYQTKPMRALGATLGGKECLNELLDLDAQ